MEVDYPRTTARTLRSRSFKLVFSKLNRGASPKSSPSIKTLYFGLHDASAPLLLTNVAVPRSRRKLQRYTTRTAPNGILREFWTNYFEGDLTGWAELAPLNRP